MNYLDDRALERLRAVADTPDLSGTRYAIESRLAEGGMGVVYRALDTVLERPVALKVLKPELSSASNIARLEREARVIARLEHPGIVPVHDLGTLPDGRVYYVMKLIQGKRLDELFAREAPIADKLRVFERIAETVAFAHAHGVIHRDLKPQNVMVGAFGEVLVLDWGVAKILDGREDAAAPTGEITPAARRGSGGGERQTGECDGREWDSPEAATRTQATSPGAVIGTPAYMAPEQARGDAARVDARSDVYALGGILFHLLTGETPASRDANTRSHGERLIAARPRPPRALAAICLKALAAEPAERYASAEALVADVRRQVAGNRVSAYRETVFEFLGRICWKYRVAIGLIAAYIVMRAVLIFWQRI